MRCYYCGRLATDNYYGIPCCRQCFDRRKDKAGPAGDDLIKAIYFGGVGANEYVLVDG